MTSMAAMLLLTVLLVGGAEAAVWADEIETESDFGVVKHQKSQETSLSGNLDLNILFIFTSLIDLKDKERFHF